MLCALRGASNAWYRRRGRAGGKESRKLRWTPSLRASRTATAGIGGLAMQLHSPAASWRIGLRAMRSLCGFCSLASCVMPCMLHRVT